MSERDVSVVVVAREPSLALARLLRSLARAEGIERAELLLALNGTTESRRRARSSAGGCRRSR